MLQNKIGNVEYLKSNDNFLELALRHFGFNGLSIIYELLDNSVSASSTHILVGWDKSEQFKGKRTLTTEQLKKSKIFPKAEQIYHTMKMISESDLRSLEYLKTCIDERIKIIKSK